VGVAVSTLAVGADLLRRHVDGGPDHGARDRERVHVVNERHAEVGQAQPARRVHEQVLRFDVAVDHVLRVGVAQGARRLADPRQALGHRVYEQRVFQSPGVLDQLVGQVGGAVDLAGVVQAHDPRVVERGGHHAFPPEALQGPRVQSSLDQLEGHLGLGLGVPGSVDHTHGAFAEPRYDHVGAHVAPRRQVGTALVGVGEPGAGGDVVVSPGGEPLAELGQGDGSVEVLCLEEAVSKEGLQREWRRRVF
jgi:hypothetical protein